jgi:hypothetical protein
MVRSADPRRGDPPGQHAPKPVITVNSGAPYGKQLNATLLLPLLASARRAASGTMLHSELL